MLVPLGALGHGRAGAAPSLLGLPQGEPAPPRVETRLVCSASRIAPGAAFELGLQFDLPAGWHTYWENSGDTGFAPAVSLALPPGFQVEGPFFPAPQRYEEEGDLVSYVLEDDPVLLWRVQPPADWVPVGVRVAAKARYLVCREACFSFQSEPSLELAAGSAAAPADARSDGVLQAARARLPRAAAFLDAPGRCTWKMNEPSPDAHVVVLHVPGATAVEFIPDSRGRRSYSGQTFRQDGGVGILSVDLLGSTPGNDDERPALRGVLRVEEAGQVVYYGIALAAPEARTDR